MDELASFKTTLYHRHYGERAYEHIKQRSSLTDLKIITYGAATNLQSLFRYVKQEYLTRVKKEDSPAKILLGLAGVAELNDAQAKEMANRVMAIARHLSTADLYLHAACHIKLLSHDGIAYLGSQNLSNGAEPYFEGVNSSKKYFNRFQEVILKVEDTNLEWVDALLCKVLDDHQLCIKITSEHQDQTLAQELIKQFVHKAKFAQTIENITTGLLLERFLQQKPALILVEFNEASTAETCKLVTAIMQGADLGQHLNELKELLLSETDVSWFKQENPLAELKRIISRLGDDFPGKVFLQDKLHDEQPLVLPEGSDERLIEGIRKVALRHDLESLEQYVEEQRDNIINSIIQSPDYSQKYMFGAIDNDGNLNEELLNNRFSESYVEWNEDEEGNLISHEHEAMSLDEKLDQIDITSLRVDLDAVFRKEIHLWADEVLKLSGDLLKELKTLYQREFDNPEFMEYVENHT